MPSLAYRAFAYATSLLLAGLVVWPSFREPPQDSFPLSDYPMFSHGRPDPMFTLTHALGVREDGTRIALPPLVSANNEEVLQSMITIWQGTMHRPARFCDEVAARVEHDDDLSDVIAVELATSTYDCVAYFDEGPEPLSRRVLHRCDVPGRP